MASQTYRRSNEQTNITGDSIYAAEYPVKSRKLMASQTYRRSNEQTNTTGDSIYNGNALEKIRSVSKIPIAYIMTNMRHTYR